MYTQQPTINLEDVEKAILGETYTVLPNGRTTVCQLTLIDNGDSGFTVEGQSACVSKENYNEVLGNKFARERALEKVWMVLGFELARKLERERFKAQETLLERLRREYAELTLRIEALSNWIDTPSYFQMSLDEQDDQREQLVLMRQYCHILDKRMARIAEAEERGAAKQL